MINDGDLGTASLSYSQSLFSMTGRTAQNNSNVNALAAPPTSQTQQLSNLGGVGAWP